MKKQFFVLFIIFCSLGQLVQAQKYFTRNGQIIFSSEAPLERIEAMNNSATSVLDAETGNLEFAVLIKGFQFEKALMQEHFNENYLESSKFPKALFKGKIANIQEIDLGRNGTYKALVKGQMTIHGVTHDLETKGTFYVDNGQIRASSNFQVTVADYDIEIPGIVRDKIAKTVDIKVDLVYEPLKR